MSAENCPKCKGGGRLRPCGYVWDRQFGWVIGEIGPIIQCADCHGTGLRLEAQEVKDGQQVTK